MIYVSRRVRQWSLGFLDRWKAELKSPLRSGVEYESLLVRKRRAVEYLNHEESSRDHRRDYRIDNMTVERKWVTDIWAACVTCENHRKAVFVEFHSSKRCSLNESFRLQLS